MTNTALSIHEDPYAGQGGPTPQPSETRRAVLLLGAKGGDNAQLLALGQALGLELDIIRLRFNVLHVLPNWLAPTSLFSLTKCARAEITRAPPADLIVACGKRSYRAARRLKHAGHGRPCWIHLGRPWGPLAAIDLVLTTPQYRLPKFDNLVTLAYPIRTACRHSQPPERARRRCIALLLGGSSTTHRLTVDDVDNVLAIARRYAACTDANIVVLTAPRTPRKVVDWLAALSLPQVDVRCYPRVAPTTTSTDYLEFIGTADEFIVTSDSASMVADAFDTGRPLHIYCLPERRITRFLVALEDRCIKVTARFGGSLLANVLISAGLLTPLRRIDRLLASLSKSRRLLTVDPALLSVQRRHADTASLDRARQLVLQCLRSARKSATPAANTTSTQGISYGR